MEYSFERLKNIFLWPISIPPIYKEGYFLNLEYSSSQWRSRISMADLSGIFPCFVEEEYFFNLGGTCLRSIEKNVSVVSISRTLVLSIDENILKIDL